MSKKNIKEAIGYNPKPVHASCMNCEHYRSDLIESKSFGHRCGLYGFAVKKMGVCNEHQWKP
jgi:exo-beta-1,3-glucanase (GH17 family)